MAAGGIGEFALVGAVGFLAKQAVLACGKTLDALRKAPAQNKKFAADIEPKLVEVKEQLESVVNSPNCENCRNAVIKTSKVLADCEARVEKWLQKHWFRKQFKDGLRYKRYFEEFEVDLDKCMNALVLGLTAAVNRKVDNIVAAQNVMNSKLDDVTTNTSTNADHTGAIKADLEKLTRPKDQTLAEWLQPQIYDDDIGRHDKAFVQGTRQWVLDDIEKWRSDLNGSPCKALLAGPGFGKSAIAVRVLKMTGDRALGFHLCQHNDSRKRDPKRLITSLAHQLAQNLPDYADILETIRTSENVDRAIDARGNARELASLLLFGPLHKSIEQPPLDNGRYFLVIDALDEAEFSSKNYLLQFVNDSFDKLPKWIALLVTARPELDICRHLSSLRPTRLDAEENKEKCQNDVKIYLDHVLRNINDKDRPDAIKKILKKSEGLFLYLYYIRQDLEQANSLSMIEALPDRGFRGVYADRFETFFPEGIDGDVRKVLEAIVVALAPLHIVEVLPALVGIEYKVLYDIVRKLSQFFPLRDNRIYVFHKSVVDWLTDDEYVNPTFAVDKVIAHKALASGCSAVIKKLLLEKTSTFESDQYAIKKIDETVSLPEEVTTSLENNNTLVEYARASVITHLHSAKLDNLALSLLCSLTFLHSRVSAGEIGELIVDSSRVPAADVLKRTLVLARHHIAVNGYDWLYEELWQRMEPCSGDGLILTNLTEDARRAARETLYLSALSRPCLTSAASPLRCMLEGHTEAVSGLTSFTSTSGQVRLASCSIDGRLCIWDPVNGGPPLHVLQSHSERVKAVTAFYNEHGVPYLASCSWDGTCKIWDPATGKVLRDFEGHFDIVYEITSFNDSNNQARLASCSRDKTVQVWHPFDRVDETQVFYHSEEMETISAFHNTYASPRLVCASMESLSILDPLETKLLQSIKIEASLVLPSERLFLATFDVNGRAQLAVPVINLDDYAETISIYDLTEDDILFLRKIQLDSFSGFCSFVDTTEAVRLAITSYHSIHIWDPVDGKQLQSHYAHQAYDSTAITSLRDENGQCLLVDSNVRGTIYVWEAELLNTNKQDKVVRDSIKKVTAITHFVDADGAPLLASISSGEKVIVIHKISGEKLKFLEGHEDEISDLTSFKIVNGDPRLATCSKKEKKFYVWDPIYGGEPLQIIKLDESFGSFLVITTFYDANDRPYLSIVDESKQVIILDPLAGKELPKFRKQASSPLGGLVSEPRVLSFRDNDKRPLMVTVSAKLYFPSASALKVWDPLKASATLDDSTLHTFYHSDYVQSITAYYNTDGSPRLLGFSENFGFSKKCIHTWDPVNGGEPLHCLRVSDVIYRMSAFVDSNKNPQIASICVDGKLRFYSQESEPFFSLSFEASKPRVLHTFSLPSSSEFSSQYLAIGHEDGSLSCFEIQPGKAHISAHA